MVELTHIDASTLRLGFAGDTYNTAVYLRRAAAELDLELEVGYLTGVGDDDYSAAMREAWRVEGIADRSVVVPGRPPGLYAIRTTATGERRFTYWRHMSAASEVFRDSDWCRGLEGDLIHLSGITLQLTSPASREALVARLAELRAAGAWVSFDTNYRPAGWSSGDAAAAAIDEVCGVANIVLASRDDEMLLHGSAAPEACVRRIAGLGATEVILRDGGAGAYVGVDGDVRHLPARPVERVIDTTAAGDAFAGGYLAGRLAGHTPVLAAGLGNGVAAVVIQHPGAITPPGIWFSPAAGLGT
ncbi:MAG: sugar kinase [Candidatus Nephthysia bennettiae]|nr:MAG: sugar kinase [Candidatus Dormibacteraeota bacterium]